MFCVCGAVLAVGSDVLFVVKCLLMRGVFCLLFVGCCLWFLVFAVCRCVLAGDRWSYGVVCGMLLSVWRGLWCVVCCRRRRSLCVLFVADRCCLVLLSVLFALGRLPFSRCAMLCVIVYCLLSDVHCCVRMFVVRCVLFAVRCVLSGAHRVFLLFVVKRLLRTGCCLSFVVCCRLRLVCCLLRVTFYVWVDGVCCLLIDVRCVLLVGGCC